MQHHPLDSFKRDPHYLIVLYTFIHLIPRRLGHSSCEHHSIPLHHPCRSTFTTYHGVFFSITRSTMFPTTHHIMNNNCRLVQNPCKIHDPSLPSQKHAMSLPPTPTPKPLHITKLPPPLPFQLEWSLPQMHTSLHTTPQPPYLTPLATVSTESFTPMGTVTFYASTAWKVVPNLTQAGRWSLCGMPCAKDYEQGTSQ